MPEPRSLFTSADERRTEAVTYLATLRELHETKLERGLSKQQLCLLRLLDGPAFDVCAILSDKSWTRQAIAQFEGKSAVLSHVVWAQMTRNAHSMGQGVTLATEWLCWWLDVWAESYPVLAEFCQS